MNSITITSDLAAQLIAEQFPAYAQLPVVAVEKQGHDNRSFKLGDDLVIRMPTADTYALKVPIEHEYLPKLKPYLSVPIPEPIKMGNPSANYPFHFSIYRWLNGVSVNQVTLDEFSLETLAAELAAFLKQLHQIHDLAGPKPGQHNWWRGEHIRVYSDDAEKQIYALSPYIDKEKSLSLLQKACKTCWKGSSVWLHGDIASGNILVNNRHKLAGIIDFGGMAMGDPACDLVIAWTLFSGKSRDAFIQAMQLDDATWLRAKAWALWKATFELSQIKDINSDNFFIQTRLINEILQHR